MSGHSYDPDHEEDVQLNEFLQKFDSGRLCAAASVLRPGVECSLGQKIVGGYSVLFEVIFADEITWLARIPLPYNSSSPDASDELMYSYAAALKYIKLHTSIPVTEVLACHSRLDKQNDIGVSYMLMERLPSRPLDMEDIYEDVERHEPICAAAEKVFLQLAGFVVQLASIQFDKIGNLREQPLGSGTSTISEYYDTGILYPPERGQIYEASWSKGPFSTSPEFHSAIISLNEKYAAVDEENEDGVYLRSVHQSRLIQLEPEISPLQYEKGPLVLNHDDLSRSNILVDKNYNITAVLDFPGTVVPLAKLCGYPSIFTENAYTPFTDRQLWPKCFLEAQPAPDGALNDVEVRNY